MADWQIKPLSKKSALSGRDIAAGDVVVCAVFVDELGNLERRDFLKDEFNSENLPAGLVGRWERTASENPEEDARAAQRMSLASSEDFFLSLFDENSAVEAPETDLLKQVLALLLERKRILRALGRASEGVQKYLHVSSRREFDVPQKDMDDEATSKMGAVLASIII